MTKLISSMLALVLGLFLVSCSKKDEGTPTAPTDQVLATVKFTDDAVINNNSSWFDRDKACAQLIKKSDGSQAIYIGDAACPKDSKKVMDRKVLELGLTEIKRESYADGSGRIGYQLKFNNQSVGIFVDQKAAQAGTISEVFEIDELCSGSGGSASICYRNIDGDVLKGIVLYKN